MTDNGIAVLKARYLLKNEKFEVIETPEDMFRRVCDAVARAEDNYPTCARKTATAQMFYDFIVSGTFMPNSPTLMNAGRGSGLLSACFVLPVDDSIDGIFSSIKNAALIQKSGGGTGFSFSRLRPCGDRVASSNGTTSGPISFMKVFSTATSAIQQGAFRRGANMGVMSVTHPDIISFINVKNDLSELSNFNLSVGITKKFMDQVKGEPQTPHIVRNPRSGEEYPLTVDGKVWSVLDVFDFIVKRAWQTGEPGVIFLDRINEDNPTPHIGVIEATNPCITGETMVYVADGRGSVSIRQLAEEGKDVPVFCQKGGKIIVGKMRNPRLTGRKMPILKITLEDGSVLRCTPNHQFLISGKSLEYKSAGSLKAGDGIRMASQFLGTMQDILGPYGSNGQDYVWTEFDGKKKAEHRIIAVNKVDRELGKSEVVHHIDYNGRNNSPENLMVMTKEDHDRLHSVDMLGDNNPMRRFPEKNWMNNPEKQLVSRKKNHIGAKRSSETKARIGTETKKRFEDVSFQEKHSDAVKTGMQEHWDSFVSGIHSKALMALEKCQSLTDLKCFLEDNSVMVERICESCGKAYSVSWGRREQSYCSNDCRVGHHNQDASIRQKIADGVRSAYSSRAGENKRGQVECLVGLKFTLQRDPVKTEWEVKCSEAGVPKRLGTKFGHKNFGALKEAALSFNHRIVSIEEDGVEDVYNGTVDEHHNFFVGGFKTNMENGKAKTLWYNNKNCGEQPLLPYESCNLGSINVAKFVENKKFNTDGFAKAIHLAIRFLDNVIDVNNYPIPETKEISLANRKIGLGIMGFADALFLMGIAYDSEEGIAFGEMISKTLQEESHQASEQLAVERGVFPNWKGSIWEKKGRHMRNAATTTQAPTGTISIIADCSGGVEPLFALSFWRNVLNGQKLAEVNPIFERIAKERGVYSKELMEKLANGDTVRHIEGLPEDIRMTFCTAHDIGASWHIRMQAAFQKYCDASISKTINCSNDATVDQVRNIFLLAYESHCKGVTVYRDGCRQNQPMQTQTKKEEPKPVEKAPVEYAKKLRLPEVMSSIRIRQSTPFGNMHVKIVVDPVSEREYEIFAQLGKGGEVASSDLEGMCRLISMFLRVNGSLDDIVEQLRGIGSNLSVSTKDGRIESLADGLARAIQKYQKARDISGLHSLLLGKTDLTSIFNGSKAEGHAVETTKGETRLNGFKIRCPECGGVITFEEGCAKCHGCGFAQC